MTPTIEFFGLARARAGRVVYTAAAPNATARDLLDAAYAGLDLANGDLVETTERPTSATTSAWIEKGEWLALGQQVGAEKIFFVNNNPVIRHIGRSVSLAIGMVLGIEQPVDCRFPRFGN